MSRPLRILLSNDDGVSAPGLAALARALRPLGEVAVIAPEHNWSAGGHSKTMHKPLRVTPARLADGSPAQASNGSPSDCVALALLGLMEKPDLVVSGINTGANIGSDLTYSGTVSAAMEAVLSGVPGLAVSVNSPAPQDYEPAAAFAAIVAARLLAEGATEPPRLLNVNVPDLPGREIRGVQITRLGRRIYRDALVTRLDPRGRAYYWIGGEPPEGIAEAGTDIGALAAGYISVTPVLLDLSDYEQMETLRGWGLAFPPAD